MIDLTTLPYRGGEKAWRAAEDERVAERRRHEAIDAAVLTARVVTVKATPRPKRGPLIKPCPDCGVATRGNKISVSRAPGTVPRFGGGRCARCTRLLTATPAARSISTVLKPCVRCQFPTRSSQTPPAYAPEARRRRAGCVCQRCWSDEHRTATVVMRKDRIVALGETVQSMRAWGLEHGMTAGSTAVPGIAVIDAWEAAR